MHIVGDYRTTAAAGPTFFGNYTMFHEFWAEDSSWSDPGDGNEVTAGWRNNGTNGTTATGDTSDYPIYRSSGINNKPSLDWDGSTDFLRIAAASTATLTQPVSVGAVMQQQVDQDSRMVTSDDATNRCIMYLSSSKYRFWSGGPGQSGTTATDTSAHLCIAKFEGGTSVYRVDGSVEISGVSPGSASFDGLTIGAEYDQVGGHFNGYMAYVFVYDGDITDESGFTTWESDIQDYYGIT